MTTDPPTTRPDGSTLQRVRLTLPCGWPAGEVRAYVYPDGRRDWRPEATAHWDDRELRDWLEWDEAHAGMDW